MYYEQQNQFYMSNNPYQQQYFYPPQYDMRSNGYPGINPNIPSMTDVEGQTLRMRSVQQQQSREGSPYQIPRSPVQMYPQPIYPRSPVQIYAQQSQPVSPQQQVVQQPPQQHYQINFWDKSIIPTPIDYNQMNQEEQLRKRIELEVSIETLVKTYELTNINIPKNLPYDQLVEFHSHIVALSSTDENADMIENGMKFVYLIIEGAVLYFDIKPLKGFAAMQLKNTQKTRGHALRIAKKYMKPSAEESSIEKELIWTLATNLVVFGGVNFMSSYVPLFSEFINPETIIEGFTKSSKIQKDPEGLGFALNAATNMLSNTDNEFRGKKIEPTPEPEKTPEKQHEPAPVKQSVPKPEKQRVVIDDDF